MNLSDYFNIVRSDDHVLFIRIRGFWSNEFAEELGTEFLEQFKSAVNRFDGHQFVLVTEESEFRVPGEKGSAVLVESLKHCQKKQLYIAIDVNPSSLGNLGLGRIAREAGMQDNRVIMKTQNEVMRFIDECRGQLK